MNGVSNLAMPSSTSTHIPISVSHHMGLCKRNSIQCIFSTPSSSAHYFAIRSFNFRFRWMKKKIVWNV